VKERRKGREEEMKVTVGRGEGEEQVKGGGSGGKEEGRR